MPILDISVNAPTPFVTVCNDRDIRFSLPADLNCITTYILLEQERWFEKEVDFIYRFASPGMTVLDIGANVGVYTLPLAKLIGPSGRVVAYEPGSVNRQHLERSLRMNRCNNVVVSAAALSDFSGSGMLHVASSGELNQLVVEPACNENVEPVAVSTLDREFERFEWTRLDFIKIDAEGHEAAIIRGGQLLLEKYSPLIMFETKHGSVVNFDPVAIFKSLGFECYRLIADGSMLVPAGTLDQLDCFQLNLFAARPDRARQLAEAGLLANPGAPTALSETERLAAVAGYCALPFAQALEIELADVDDCPYAEALIAYAAYRFLTKLPPDKRLALLQFAYDDLVAYGHSTNSPGALTTLSRVAFDIGLRTNAVAALNRLLDVGRLELDEPFFPPSPRYEGIGAISPTEWFADAINEAYELWNSWSTIFRHDIPRLEWLVLRQQASDEMARRLMLTRARGGMLTERPTIQMETGSLEIPHNADWLALVRSLANEV